MCWSANGSLQTYAVAMALAAVHYSKGRMNPVILLLLFLFAQIQLVEYFLWKNLTVSSMNQLWSGIGVSVLILQPVVSAMLLPDDMRNKAWLIMLSGTVLYFLTHKVNLSTQIGGNGHLKWNWIPSLASPWAIAWLVMLLGPMWISGHRSAFMFGLFTYLFSAYFNDKYGTAGSYWCWISVSVFILAFFNDVPRRVLEKLRVSNL
jgi:hypothetical protein